MYNIKGTKNYFATHHCNRNFHTEDIFITTNNVKSIQKSKSLYIQNAGNFGT